MRPFAIALALAAFAGPAAAFDIDGLRSGMPIADALAAGQAQGYSYGAPRERDGALNYTSGNGGPGLSAVGGKLCAFGWFRPGDIDLFVELVRRRSEAYGAPLYDNHREIMGDGKAFAQHAARWRAKGDRGHVILSQVGDNGQRISMRFVDDRLCPGVKL